MRVSLCACKQDWEHWREINYPRCKAFRLLRKYEMSWGFQLTSRGLSLRSNISTKWVLRNASVCKIWIEFDFNDKRCMCSISLNANDLISTRFRLNSRRNSYKRGRWRNACGWIVINPVLIIKTCRRLYKPWERRMKMSEMRRMNYFLLENHLF